MRGKLEPKPNTECDQRAPETGEWAHLADFQQRVEATTGRQHAVTTEIKLFEFCCLPGAFCLHNTGNQRGRAQVRCSEVRAEAR